MLFLSNVENIMESRKYEMKVSIINKSDSTLAFFSNYWLLKLKVNKGLKSQRIIFFNKYSKNIVSRHPLLSRSTTEAKRIARFTQRCCLDLRRVLSGS